MSHFHIRLTARRTGIESIAEFDGNNPEPYAELLRNRGGVFRPLVYQTEQEARSVAEILGLDIEVRETAVIRCYEERCSKVAGPDLALRELGKCELCGGPSMFRTCRRCDRAHHGFRRAGAR